MYPIDFEDARDAYHWLAVEETLELAMAMRRDAERAEKRRQVLKWRNHWRTRLSVWLAQMSLRIALPMPCPIEDMAEFGVYLNVITERRE